MLAALCFLGFCVTAIMFVVYWWKKRKARLAAGENYQSDENYQHVSSRKRLIGWLCLLSFAGMIISLKTAESPMTPEEKVAYQEEKAQREAEAKRRAEEKAQQEAEAKRLAEEKKAQEEAEAKRRAEEKAAQEAEAKRLADEKAAQEAEAKRRAEEKAQQETEAKRLAEEKAAQEAEAKRLAEEKAQEAEDSGLWDSAKSFVKDKLSDAKDFAGGVVSNEVYVCDKKISWDGKPRAYYIIPSTKKRHDDGIVFKDEGYEIEVICKGEDGTVLNSVIYLFCERSDGTWEYKRERENNWHRIMHTYSDLDKELGGDLGKLIYDASKNFPNL